MDKIECCDVKELTTIGDKKKAAMLAMNVFMEYEAPEYSQEGVEIFREYVNDKKIVMSLDMYGAFLNNEIVGMIATRNEGSHISLFFVEGKYHRNGIGRLLFSTMIRSNTSGVVTVNSSPFAVEVYRRFGFTKTDVEQLRSGIRYTPMELRL